MKKKKIPWGELIGDIVVELVVTAVFFGLGALVLRLFGAGIDAEYVDFDSLCLIGILTMCLIVAVGTFIRRLFKRKKIDKQEK